MRRAGENAMGKRRAVWIGFAAGVVAAALMGIVMLIVRMAAGVPTYPELIGNALGAHVPIALFNASTGTLGTGTKPALFSLLMTIMVLVGGALGILYTARLARPDRGLRGVLFPAVRLGGIVWLVVMLVLSPIVGAGFLGASLPDGPTGYLLTGLLLFGLYAVTLAGMAEAMRRAFATPVIEPSKKKKAEQIAIDERRRALLHNVAIGAAVLSLGGLFVQVRRFAFHSVPGDVPASSAAQSPAVQQAAAIAQTARAQAGPATDPAFATVAAKLPAEVTDADDFYVISKNFSDPVVPLTKWQIKIDGLVNQPFTLTYDDLLAMPSVTFLRTMECISNDIGDHLISNGQWTGVPLHMVLEKAGVKAGAIKVQFTAYDGYTTAIPITEAMEQQTILAYHLNGVPLPTRHGYPARLIFPAHYGMKNPKWITGITLTSDDYLGYWERQGWTDSAVVQTMSRIDTPMSKDSLAVGVETAIAGIAYAGNRSISKVEVSTDNGESWHDAALQPPLGPLTWVFWAYRWTPAKAGKFTAVVRATDGAGTLQPAEKTDPIPLGATGYHHVSLTVR
jgi:DMSO/TMAO reductase YedYZ molybdopterin-dependent catalytic subunit